ncbi:RNA polymerase sigma factor [Pontivivens ytuae]|uniref:RNA polymerase sigma factor n=1 Tax=Pontivivens ytuae TaxID=2789856 RepID=A0A7S9LQR2_9RHOB|nr:RNA polymerase sigma factor [Pontivivens ytuae]QPH53374.1 RNA polymerase sigma factor [Pontivivens ytuae]
MAPDTEREIDDADLMARYARGDQSAARALATRHAPRALSVATRMLGDAAEAQDVTQEAMMRLFRIAPEWDPTRARVSTWLYRVVSNLCIDRLRVRRRGAPLHEIAEPVDERPSAAAMLQHADRAEALHAALAQLPERQRLAITLRHIEELPNPEIAAAMEISVEAVESLLARGRRALATLLSDRRDALGPIA